MAWIRLDENLLFDEWYLSLSEPCKVAWIHLLLLANRNRGKTKKSGYKLLCQHLFCTENAAEELMISAKKSGKVTDPGDGWWHVANHKKYQPDPTNAERQEKHRQKANVTVTKRDSRYVTQVTPTSTSTVQDKNNSLNSLEIPSRTRARGGEVNEFKSLKASLGIPEQPNGQPTEIDRASDEIAQITGIKKNSEEWFTLRSLVSQIYAYDRNHDFTGTAGQLRDSAKCSNVRTIVGITIAKLRDIRNAVKPEKEPTK